MAAVDHFRLIGLEQKLQMESRWSERHLSVSPITSQAFEVNSCFDSRTRDGATFRQRLLVTAQSFLSLMNMNRLGHDSCGKLEQYGRLEGQRPHLSQASSVQKRADVFAQPLESMDI